MNIIYVLCTVFTDNSNGENEKWIIREPFQSLVDCKSMAQFNLDCVLFINTAHIGLYLSPKK